MCARRVYVWRVFIVLPLWMSSDLGDRKSGPRCVSSHRARATETGESERCSSRDTLWLVFTCTVYCMLIELDMWNVGWVRLAYPPSMQSGLPLLLPRVHSPGRHPAPPDRTACSLLRKVC